MKLLSISIDAFQALIWTSFNREISLIFIKTPQERYITLTVSASTTSVFILFAHTSASHRNQ